MLTTNVDDEANNFNVQDKDPINSSLIVAGGKFVFKKGETFGTYEEVLERLELHQRESFVYYWRRDTRTVEHAFTKTSRPLAACLKYYTVHFACVFGGQKFQARGSGKRSRQRVTKRVNCPANIFFRAAKCGKLLEVMSVCNVHNHEISEELFNLLPQNRKMSEILKEEVAELLKLKVDRKKIIEYIKVKENKNITSKDLFNLSASRLKTGKDKIKIFNDRISILNRIITNVTIDGKIKELCTKELTILKNKFISIAETEPLVEYSTNTIDKFCGDNGGTIIKPNTQSETVETNQIFNKICDKNIIIIDPKDCSQICNISESIDFNNIAKLNNFIDVDEIVDVDNDEISNCENEIIEDFIVEEQEYETNTFPFDGYLEGEGNLELISSSPKDENNEIIKCNITNNLDFIKYKNTDQQFNGTTEKHELENLKNLNEDNLHETLILYETTTEHIDEIGKNPGIIVNNYNKENKIKSVNSNTNIDKTEKLDMKKLIWKLRQKIDKCNKCGSKTKLLNMQIKYLKAQRNKLIEETKLLRLKRKKLKDCYSLLYC